MKVCFYDLKAAVDGIYYNGELGMKQIKKDHTLKGTKEKMWLNIEKISLDFLILTKMILEINKKNDDKQHTFLEKSIVRIEKFYLTEERKCNNILKLCRKKVNFFLLISL